MYLKKYKVFVFGARASYSCDSSCTANGQSPYTVGPSNLGLQGTLYCCSTTLCNTAPGNSAGLTCYNGAGTVTQTVSGQSSVCNQFCAVSKLDSSFSILSKNVVHNLEWFEGNFFWRYLLSGRAQPIRVTLPVQPMAKACIL